MSNLRDIIGLALGGGREEIEWRCWLHAIKHLNTDLAYVILQQTVTDVCEDAHKAIYLEV